MNDGNYHQLVFVETLYQFIMTHFEKLGQLSIPESDEEVEIKADVIYFKNGYYDVQKKKFTESKLEEIGYDIPSIIVTPRHVINMDYHNSGDATFCNWLGENTIDEQRFRFLVGRLMFPIEYDAASLNLCIESNDDAVDVDYVLSLIKQHIFTYNECFEFEHSNNDMSVFDWQNLIHDSLSRSKYLAVFKNPLQVQYAKLLVGLLSPQLHNFQNCMMIPRKNEKVCHHS